MATHKSLMALARQHEAKNFVMLAHKYNPEKSNVLGWNMQEKIDGVRARWGGNGFYSRTNKEFPCPEEIILYYQNIFGQCRLDGELFAGRGKFQTAVSIVRNSHSTVDDWHHLTYVLFDCVRSGVSYILRQEGLNVYKNLPYIHVLPLLKRVKTEEDISTTLRYILAKNGEGLMFKNPNGQYKFGRSKDVLKYKQWLTDEAFVLQELPGEGKHFGVIGSLQCLWNERYIKIGTGLSDEERRQPMVGKKVTFKYFGLTDDGNPRHPKFIGVRDYE